MKETKAVQIERVPLKTADDLTAARERVTSGAFAGTIDPRTATAINTTINAQQKLRFELRLKYMGLLLQAKKLKIDTDLPKLPEGF